jgi:hypothetical protein
MRRIATVILLTLLACSPAAAQVMRLAGTTKDTFLLDALDAAPVTLQSDSGRLELPGGLLVSGGAIDLSAATLTLPTISTIDINGGTLDGVTIDTATIGGTTPGAGSFTTLACNAGLTISAGGLSITGPLDLSGSTVDINAGTIDGTTIGGDTAAAGTFTTLSATSVSASTLASTVATGTAPLTVTSTTRVDNLNAQYFNGYAFPSGSDGGVVYQFNAATLATVTPSTAGKLLKCNGSSAPSWAGLSTGKIWIGSGGTGLPTEQSVSGDATLGTDGSLTLAGSLVDLWATADVSAAAEVSDQIACACQIEDGKGSTLANRHLVFWVLSDDSTSAAETSQTVSTAYTNGTEFESIVADKKGAGFTNSSGLLRLTVTHTGNNTMYMHFVVAGRVYTTTVNFD